MEFNANTSLAVMQLSGKAKFTHKVLVGNMDNPSIDNQNQVTLLHDSLLHFSPIK